MSQTSIVSENKNVASRAISQVIGDGDFDAGKDLFAEDVAQYGGAGGDLEGLDALQEWMSTVYEAFPDFAATEAFNVCEDDLVASRVTYTGTHEGEFMGIPATGKHVEITGTTIFRIDDGKITESWVETDTTSLLRQVGALEAPQN